MKLRRHIAGLPAVLTLPLILATCSEPVTAPRTATPQYSLHASGIVINEVMADPAAVSDDGGEWFELHNTGTSSINVSGWTIVSNNDGGGHTISGNVTIAAGGFKVFGRSSRSKNNGGISGVYAYGTGITLANGSDWLVLRDGTGAMVDSVSWTSSASGVARGVIDPVADNADASGGNWAAQTSTYGKGDRGTPGARNDGFAAAPVAVTVSPASATVTVGSTQGYTATATDASGAPVATTFTWTSSATAVATVDASGVVTGVAAGSATIRATAANGVYGEAAVTVQEGSGGGTAGDLVVKVLDVGQGDATYITDGVSKIFIDGGPSTVDFGAHLDALGLNNTTIDVVIISHAHFDHYSGLRELFETGRNITVRYLFENKDAGTAVSLAQLRDSINARVGRGQLIYRDTDNPCGNGAPLCTITLAGGAKLHVLQPDPNASDPNNRSAAVKLVGADSASFSMWFAGDAEHEAIGWFDTGANYDLAPGMNVNVLKADHHGSCNGVTRRYLELTSPDWVAVGVGATNSYGHMHTQTKDLLNSMSIPWYRTDENGTITFRAPGTPGSGYTVTVERGTASRSGAGDATSAQSACQSL